MNTIFLNGWPKGIFYQDKQTGGLKMAEMGLPLILIRW